MSLGDELKDELLSHLGGPYDPPCVVVVRSPGDAAHPAVEISVEAIAVQPFACAVRELRVATGLPGATTMETLKRWANALCQRITYLLENLGPLEFDIDGQEVLIRSMPPVRTGGAQRYYEIRLTALTGGGFRLARYEAKPGDPRSLVPLELGMEQLVRLANDVVETVPASA